MNERRPAFAAALLAGGRSSRMGTDKALLDWHGVPLWRAQMGKLMELNPDRLLLSCREEQGLKNVFAKFAFDPPGNPGPLGAIVRCLEIAGPGPLLVLAVDMPHMSSEFLRTMIGPCEGDRPGLVCRGAHGFEALCAVYPAAALEPMRAMLREGRFAMQAAVGRLVAAGLMRVRELRADEVPLFFNANTPEDWAWTKPAPNASN